MALGGNLSFDGAVVSKVAGHVLEGADPFTIRPLNSYLSADKDHVWSYTFIIPLADGATFKPLGGVDGIYAKDAAHVYYHEAPGFTPMENADPKTFKVLDFGYALDARQVYASGKVIEGIGSRTQRSETGFQFLR